MQHRSCKINDGMLFKARDHSSRLQLLQVANKVARNKLIKTSFPTLFHVVNPFNVNIYRVVKSVHSRYSKSISADPLRLSFQSDQAEFGPCA